VDGFSGIRSAPGGRMLHRLTECGGSAETDVWGCLKKLHFSLDRQVAGTAEGKALSRGGRAQRRLSAEEKPRILEEARAPNTTVAEVRRRHQLDGATFYRWERDAKADLLAALGEQARVREDDKDREIERLKAEVERKGRIMAEVVDENLALKRGL